MCGSSQPAAPTSTTSTQTSIPEYARPYVEKMLGQTEALSATPYQTYDRERVAGFNPMQQQAFQGAQGMQGAPQMAAATGMAQQAGLQALGTQYQGGQFQNQFPSPRPVRPCASGDVPSSSARPSAVPDGSGPASCRSTSRSSPDRVRPTPAAVPDGSIPASRNAEFYRPWFGRSVHVALHAECC